jgi:hypothetical protein
MMKRSNSDLTVELDRLKQYVKQLQLTNHNLVIRNSKLNTIIKVLEGVNE